jgi:Ca-activated chloride channel family protein
MVSKAVVKYGAATLGALGLAGYLYTTYGPGPGPYTYDQALVQLTDYVEDVKPQQQFVNWRAQVPLGSESSIEEALPPIDKFPLTVDPATQPGQVAIEIFSSTEKSGKGTDGWLVTVAEEFNRQNVKLSDGRTAKVKLRYIPSGTG